MWLLARSKRLDSTHIDKIKPDISFDSFLFQFHDPDSHTSLTKAQETHTCAAPSASHLLRSNQVEITWSDEKWQNVVFTWNWGRSHPWEGFLAPSPCPCGWGTPPPCLVRQPENQKSYPRFKRASHLELWSSLQVTSIFQKSQSYSPSPLASRRCPQDRCLLPSLFLKPWITNETREKEQMLCTLELFA